MSVINLDIDAIQHRARENIESGAVVLGYHGDQEKVLQLLNDALATELVCVLRYKRHHEMAKGIHSEGIANEFLEHATEEQEHADMLAKRITQLNGEPDFSPDSLTDRSHTRYVECDTLSEMIRENLIAERIAIETYTEMIRFIDNSDPTTRRMLEDILKQEEEHADDLARLLSIPGLQ